MFLLKRSHTIRLRFRENILKSVDNFTACNRGSLFLYNCSYEKTCMYLQNLSCHHHRCPPLQSSHQLGNKDTALMELKFKVKDRRVVFQSYSKNSLHKSQVLHYCIDLPPKRLAEKLRWPNQAKLPKNTMVKCTASLILNI